MSQKHFGSWFHRFVEGLAPARRSGRRPSRARRRPALEPLEGRALLANITASAVISSVADASHFDYTITLTNSAASSSPIGTFWFAWTPVPDRNFLASNPLSVTPPTGWTDTVTHGGPSDGYGIEFVATNAASDVQPGGSLNFSFQSSDAPASVNGNAASSPGTPVGTSFVYPGAPFSDAGHEFVVTSAPTPTPTPTPTPAPTPTPTSTVTVTDVRLITGKRHTVTGIAVDFSGGVIAAQVQNLGSYSLTTAGKHGSFTARGTTHPRLRSATFDATRDEVTLTLAKGLALKKPVQFVVQAAGNGIFLITRGGVTPG